MATYGLTRAHYQDCSFLGERSLRKERGPNAFVELQTRDVPFDSALFCELDADFKPTGEPISLAFEKCLFDIAVRTAESIAYQAEIAYRD